MQAQLEKLAAVIYIEGSPLYLGELWYRSVTTLTRFACELKSLSK